MNKVETKVFALTFLVLTTLILLTTLVSAEFWSCFSKGQVIDFCNPLVPDRTCSFTTCKLCMSNFNSASNCYNQGNWQTCNGLTSGSCSSGSGGVDSTPPAINLINPTEGGVYTERAITFSFTLNEKSDVYYLDNINGRGRWSRVCSGCSSITQKRNFNEGLNDITIRAKDVNGNFGFKDVSFFIDSKKPKISKAEPKKGFASGEFSVEFTEANPQMLILHYGNSETGMQNSLLDVSEDCSLIGKEKYSCTTSVNIDDYDSQTIEYWFELTDLGGNVVTSKRQFLSVDTTFPVINSMTSVLNRNKVTFVTHITEQNFADMSYIDNSESRPKWRKMCSRLINNICEKSITLRSGTHDLTVQVNDKAGNSVGENMQIVVP